VLLITSPEYEQALAFDQLRNIMRNGQAFVGFQEAPIDFPPTFKYDVLRTLKRIKSRKDKDKPPNALDLSEVEEREAECRADDEDSEGEGEEGDVISVASSAAPASFRSRHTGGEEEEEDYFQGAQSASLAHPNGARSAVSLVHKGVSKAKAKWMTLLTPGSGILPLESPSAKSASFLSSKRSSMLTLPPNGRTVPNSPTIPVTPTFPSTPLIPAMRLSKSTPTGSTNAGLKKTPSSKKATSVKSGRGADESEEENIVEKGVYDSSSKQRVPSW
jgi:hypothetical protein